MIEKKNDVNEMSFFKRSFCGDLICIKGYFFSYGPFLFTLSPKKKKKNKEKKAGCVTIMPSVTQR